MLDNIALRFQKYAPLVLRIGLAAVFVLFGLKKLMSPSQATAEIQLLMNFGLADAAAMNFYLGLFEIIIATALIIGFKIRVFTVIASAFLFLFFFSFFAKYGFSINPDLYRDLGLLGAAIALFLLGAGPFSIDGRKRAIKHENKKT